MSIVISAAIFPLSRMHALLGAGFSRFGQVIHGLFLSLVIE